MALTTIRILKDAPADDTYTDVRWFASTGPQTSFFASKTVGVFSDCSYQRVQSTVPGGRPAFTVTIPDVADKYYDCNYLMFQNGDFGSKWFYAFIRSVDYISPMATRIQYEIDWFQSYMTQFEIKPSFVEREHASAAEDQFFANTTPEPIGVDYWEIMSKQEITPAQIGVLGGPFITAAVTPDKELIESGVLQYGALYSGIYSGTYYRTVSASAYASMNSFLQELNEKGKIDQVQAIFMSPVMPLQGTQANAQPWVFQTPPNIGSITTASGSYTFRNRKLACWPFCFYRLRPTTGGQEVDLKPELCGSQLTGQTVFSNTPDATMALIPNYDGQTPDYTQMVTYNNIVQCSWSKDTYANWLAQNQVSNSIKTIAAVTKVGMAAATGNIIPAISGANDILSIITENLSMKQQPDSGHGNPLNGSLAMTMGREGFEIYHYVPNPQAAQRIDDFFNMFGYAVHKVKVPNTDTRAAWNYIKCQNVVIAGSVPVQGMAQIKAAFNRGIRLWHIDNVGDYSANNAAK